MPGLASSPSLKQLYDKLQHVLDYRGDAKRAEYECKKISHSLSCKSGAAQEVFGWSVAGDTSRVVAG